MFYVFSGYTSPDSDLDYPDYQISEYNNKDDMLEFVNEFKKNTESDNDYYSNVELRIFEGKEIFLKEKTVIKEWDIK